MPTTATTDDMDDVMAQMAAAQLSRKQKRSSQSHTPKRRSVRIEKPRSIQPSPSLQERRRTITSFRPHATLADHYRRMFGDDKKTQTTTQSSSSRTTRPASWHPSVTGNTFSNYPDPSVDNSNDFYESLQNLDLAGQPYTTSFQLSDPFQRTETSPPAWYDYGMQSSQYHHASDTTWSSLFGNQFASISGPPSYSTVLDEHNIWYSPEFLIEPTQLPNYPVTTLQRSEDQFAPDTLQRVQTSVPVRPQEEEKEMSVLVETASKELVGMGLYDPPGSSPLQFGFSGRKGLTLEESWQPPEEMIKSGRGGVPQTEDDSSDDDEELPKPAEAAAGAAPMVNLAGQTFLFEDQGDDTIAQEWWYHQLKRNPTHNTGFGHGWLQT